MKRIILVLFAIGITAMSSVSMAAMSSSRIRKETRFLTDKMAYELNLNTAQYNDMYEINYDFIYSIRYLIDDVVDGNEWALDDYYKALDIRNDDLRWVLSDSQYRRFLGLDYFYRPIYVTGGRWNFRINIIYVNHNHFYFPKPYHYRSYCGGHYRTHYPSGSFYRGRHNHTYYQGRYSVRDDKTYRNYRRSDFGSVNIRPNTSVRPSGRPVSRPTSRPTKENRPVTSPRPGTSSRPRPETSTRPRPETSTRPGTSTTPRRENSRPSSRRESTSPSGGRTENRSSSESSERSGSRR